MHSKASICVFKNYVLGYTEKGEFTPTFAVIISGE